VTSRTTPEFDLFPAAATLDKLTPSHRGASTKCAAAGIRHVSLWPAPPEILAPSEREINTRSCHRAAPAPIPARAARRSDGTALVSVLHRSRCRPR
jgi:hypothetical protein